MSTAIARYGRGHTGRGYLLPFLVGGFGGMAPILLKMAVDLTQHRKLILDAINSSILLGMLVLVVVGGVVVLAFGENNLKKAMFLGLSVPSLFTNTVSNATTGPALAGASFSVETAVEASEQVAVSDRRVRIYLSDYNDGTGNQLHLIFRLAQDGDETREARVSEAVSVPPSATQLQVSTGSAESTWIALPATAGTTLSLILVPEKKTLYGLYYALGVNTKPYVLSVKSQTLSALRIDQVEASDGCSFVTLRNAGNSASFLTGLRLTDGHMVTLPLNPRETVQPNGKVEIYLGSSCLSAPSIGVGSTVIFAVGSEALNPVRGLVRLLNSEGREIDSFPYGRSNSISEQLSEQGTKRKSGPRPKLQKLPAQQ